MFIGRVIQKFIESQRVSYCMPIFCITLTAARTWPMCRKVTKCPLMYIIYVRIIPMPTLTAPAMNNLHFVVVNYVAVATLGAATFVNAEQDFEKL